MVRRVHYLPGNKSNEQPSNIIWFDTETKHTVGPDRRQYHYLWFGWACYQRREKGDTFSPPEWHRFDNIDDFWQWVESKTRSKTRLYLMCHNGTFDLPVVHMFKELPARGWTLKSAVVDAPPIILKWVKRTCLTCGIASDHHHCVECGRATSCRTIRFVDTLNIWRMSAEKIGESVGVPKLPMPGQSASRSEWDTYCRRDVEVIRAAFLQWLTFLKDNDLGGFAPTLASQAMKSYTHRFMDHQILIDDNTMGLAIAREGYLGGRVECFRIGRYKGPFYYLDVNSHYPAVMQSGRYPIRLLGVWGEPSFKELRESMEGRSVIARVEIDTDEPVYPIVHEKRLTFPVGRFSATLCGPELEYALDHGHVLSASRAAVFEDAPIFKGFVDFMYEQKRTAAESGDEVTYWLFRILQNSLYGKFGQRGRRYEITGTCDPDLIEAQLEVDADTGETIDVQRFGGIEQTYVDEGESAHSYPAIAAYVASYGRLKLWLAMVRAGRQNVLYCDTDSMVVTPEGYRRMDELLDDYALGAWSLVDELPYVVLHGPKDYDFGGKKRTKGVKRNAEWLDDNTVEQDQFVGFRGLLNMKQLESPVVGRVIKRLKREYQKGTVLPDGRVEPYVMGGDGA